MDSNFSIFNSSFLPLIYLIYCYAEEYGLGGRASN